MTIVVINKTVGSTPFSLNVAGFTANFATGYTIVEGHFDTPLMTPLAVSNNVIHLQAPPLSITTITVIGALKNK